MEFLKLLKEELMPKHIGIIMDGNGRWAKKRNLPRTMGHKAGMEKVIEIVETSVELNIESLSLFAFSTENWKRPEEEIEGLMNILVIFINNELKRLIKNNVKLNIMGDISRLATIPRNAVIKAVEKTSKNSGLTLNIALNYGGQTEIIRATKNILKDVISEKLNIEDLDEEKYKDYLYTSNQNMPDLIIRPSGEERISNFMLYQIAYSEFYFSDVLWPDFNKEEYYKAILDYQKRDRRYGGL